MKNAAWYRMKTNCGVGIMATWLVLNWLCCCQFTTALTEKSITCLGGQQPFHKQTARRQLMCVKFSVVSLWNWNTRTKILFCNACMHNYPKKRLWWDVWSWSSVSEALGWCLFRLAKVTWSTTIQASKSLFWYLIQKFIRKLIIGRICGVFWWQIYAKQQTSEWYRDMEPDSFMFLINQFIFYPKKRKLGANTILSKNMIAQ